MFQDDWSSRLLDFLGSLDSQIILGLFLDSWIPRFFIESEILKLFPDSMCNPGLVPDSWIPVLFLDS